MSSTAFGLHVGNTSLCLAVSKEGKTDVVASPTGDRTTPAMVAFQDSEILVGLAAKQGRIRNLGNTITRNKAVVAGEAGEEWLQASPVTISQQGDQLVYQVDYKEREHSVTPSEVLGHMCRYMCDIAATHTSQPVAESSCVLTVPPRYTAAQRSAVATAAAQAGFRVVQTVSEPVAACLAYGLGQTDTAERLQCLVVRVGGASMAVSVVLVTGGCYSILASQEVELGGDQVTDTLVQFLAKEFQQKYKEDILTNKRGRAKLAAQAEVVKHVLSTLDTAHCYVESLWDGMDFSCNVTRARFDNQLSPVLASLLQPVSSVLSEAGLAVTDIQRVVVAGGTGKVVKLQTALAGLFPQAELLTSLAPDEVAATGAAVQAALLGGEAGPGQAGHPTRLSTLAADLTATVEGGAGVPLLLAGRGCPVPLRRTIQLDCSGGEGLAVGVAWGGAALARLSLSAPPSTPPRYSLSVHIHRDGSTHLTLADKASGTSSDVTLRPAAREP